ncbi:MAG: gamma-glutamyltransferase family protein [Rhizobiaceae bacterium]
MRDLQLPGRSPVIAENGLAATAHPLGTATALTILKDGGNAVDAALAAAATLAVVEPAMTGIGGDCFVMVAEPDGTVHALNGSGRAGSGADAAWYRENGFGAMPQTGVHAVTAPGAVRAWEALHNRFATLPFDRLFSDALGYAEDGFAVHDRVSVDWALAAELLARDEGGRKNCLIGDKAPAPGQRFRFPALAKTLRRIAAGGGEAFYTGEIAAEIAKTVQAGGGFLHEADLAQTSADWIDPLSAEYGGQDILELPPNGQGIIALLMLNLMRETGFAGFPPHSADRQHMLIEIGRAAYSVRDAMVADPAHMSVSVDEILSVKFAARLAAGIDPVKRNTDLKLPPLPDADTTYLTVVDRNRLAVSFINSLYNGFGSKIVTPQSGVVLQNRGGCFTLQEGHPNELKPGKRPMHTIIPALAMEDGKTSVSFGVMGGSYQPLGHALFLSNLLDHSMDVQQAIDFPRLFWTPEGKLIAEAGISGQIKSDLRHRGHDVIAAPLPIGGGQAIIIDNKNGFLVGGSDARKDGLALGW